MNRTIIRSTVIALAVLAVSVSINAQSSQQYAAEIPFDFEARGQQHSAGKYRLGSVSVNTPSTIALLDVRGRSGSVLGIAAQPGNNNWDKPGTLTFIKMDGKYYLSEISTATFKLKMKATKTAVRDLASVASVKVPVK